MCTTKLLTHWHSSSFSYRLHIQGWLEIILTRTRFCTCEQQPQLQSTTAPLLSQLQHGFSIKGMMWFLFLVNYRFIFYHHLTSICTLVLLCEPIYAHQKSHNIRIELKQKQTAWSIRIYFLFIYCSLENQNEPLKRKMQ